MTTETVKKWRANNKDKLRAYKKRPYNILATKRFRKSLKGRFLKNKSRFGYKITYLEYLNLVEKQKGICALCNEPKQLFIDHEHNTGQVRGLLCRNCNLGLGFFKDNLILLDKAKKYLGR